MPPSELRWPSGVTRDNAAAVHACQLLLLSVLSCTGLLTSICTSRVDKLQRGGDSSIEVVVALSHGMSAEDDDLWQADVDIPSSASRAPAPAPRATLLT